MTIEQQIEELVKDQKYLERRDMFLAAIITGIFSNSKAYISGGSDRDLTLDIAIDTVNSLMAKLESENEAN